MAAAYAWPDREMKKEREIIYCTPQSAVVLLITLANRTSTICFFLVFVGAYPRLLLQNGGVS